MSGKIIVPLEDRGFLIAYEGVLPHKLPAPEASDLLFKESGVKSQESEFSRQTNHQARELIELPNQPVFQLGAYTHPEPWRELEDGQVCQSLTEWQFSAASCRALRGCVWKEPHSLEEIKNWLLQTPEDPLCNVAQQVGAAVIHPDQPLKFQRLDIPKPWGFEGWYTGVEKRGVVRVGAATGSTELPHALSLFPSELHGSHPEQLVLLKTLNPVPQEVLGDLYLELHEEKWEVYVVTEIDRVAWPDGEGIVKAGGHPEKLRQFQETHGAEWKAAFRQEFRETIRRYEKVRREIDRQLDETKQQWGLDPNAPLQPEQLQQLLETVPETQAQVERNLRLEVEGFIGDCRVRVGDIVVFPTFNLHSLRHGIRVVEFQTPHYERRIAFFGQKVLTQAHWDTDRALEVMDLVPYQPPALQLVRVEAGVRVEQFVDFPDFRAFRVTLAAGQSCAWETGAEYHLWIAVNGTVSFGWTEGATELSAEESLMMPVARGTYEVSNPGSEPLILLLAQPHSTANG